MARTVVEEGRFRASVYAYELPGGWTVWAGAGDRDNDLLSIRLARPNDVWFHVKSLPGSHVLLRCEDGREPDRDTLKAAAAVAAYHSKARNAGTVPVSMTRASNVTKARGAPRGEVRIRREEVMKVRPAIP